MVIIDFVEWQGEAGPADGLQAAGLGTKPTPYPAVNDARRIPTKLCANGSERTARSRD